MHTVELLEQALRVATQLGYRVRQEWLGGSGGGCQIKGQKWIFLDLSLSLPDQLEQVAEVLRSEPATRRAALTPALERLLDRDRGVRRAA